MELNSKAIHDVIHPTAAFAQRSLLQAVAEPHPTPWVDSQLNPKNRIDSLEPLADPLWRIDGCTGLGTQFYAVPLFLDRLPPMRFDVFIPEKAAVSPLLRKLFDLDAAFHVKDASRLERLGVSRLILRALQIWTLRTGFVGPGSVASMYENLPFGSRIIFQSLELNVNDISITVAPMHNLERQLLSISRLEDHLGLSKNALPKTVDITRLRLIHQLQDSVCLVHIDAENHGHSDDDGEMRPWILKALTSGSKYLYHELRALLNMPPHPHVASPPPYLVTKYCKFGGKTAVIGFILPYYSGGGLRDSLPLWRIQGQLTIQQELRWAIQLTSAVCHVRERGKFFYPDLRLDNIVLSASGDIVMVDFEQRGVWCEFAAPEVNALEYVRILANAEVVDDGEMDGFGVPEEVRDRYAAMLSSLLPGWEVLEAREEYTPPDVLGYDGYNIPWLCLDAEEQQAAEVYMLGRVLWCMFEGQSAPQPGAVWQSYSREPDLEFPAFRRTPPKLRSLIDRCTSGRRSVLSTFITRQGSRLVLRSIAPGQPQDPARIVEVARNWWSQEVEAAEDFLRKRDELKERDEWNSNYYARPKLREVLATLEAFKAEIGI